MWGQYSSDKCTSLSGCIADAVKYIQVPIAPDCPGYAQEEHIPMDVYCIMV